MSFKYQRSSAPRTTAVQQNKLTINAMMIDDRDLRQANTDAIWPWNGGMDEHYTEVEEGDILMTRKEYLENYSTSATNHPDESTLVPVFVSWNGLGNRLRGDSVFTAMHIFLQDTKVVGVSPRAYTKNHNGPVTADKRGIITMVNGPRPAVFGDIAMCRVLQPGEQVGDTRPNARRGIIKTVIEPLSKNHMYPLVKDMIAVERGTYAANPSGKTYDHIEFEYANAIREMNDAILTVLFTGILVLKSDPAMMSILNGVNGADTKEQFFDSLVAGGSNSFRSRFFEVLSDREEFRKIAGLKDMQRSPTAEYLESASEGPLQAMVEPIIQYFKSLMNWKVGTYNVTTGPWAPTEVDLKL